jgi:rhodanese-related sulfurtransferase
MARQNFIDFETKRPNANFDGVEDITADELNQKMSQVVIIDVRRPDEWTGDLGHISKAKLITLSTLADHLDKLPTDQTIVFVCRSGGRSAQATSFAKANGLSSVYNLSGGMIAWNASNLPTEGKDDK